MESKEVIKHSASIQISNRINLLQRQAWNILLANAYYDLPKKDTYTISVKDLSKILQVDLKNDKYLKTLLKSLVSCAVEWNLFEKDKGNQWEATSLLSYCSLKDGVCSYRYDKSVREKLYNPAIYTKISLLIQKRFQSKHSLALYELCLDYLGSKRDSGETPYIDVDHFRTLMGIEEMDYPDFKKLNLRVIKEPVSEINNLESSVLTIEIEYKKEKRKVIAIKFHIKRKNSDIKLLSSPTEENLPEEQKNICNKLIEIGITKQIAKDLIETYSLKSINDQIEWLEYRNPKDPQGMLIQSIKEAWAIPNELKSLELETEENNKFSNLLEKARTSNYIIFPNGKKSKILSVKDNGYIETIGDDKKKYMVHPEKVFESSFE